VKANPPILAALSLSLLVGLAACGKKGDLLPPLSKIPSPPSGVGAVQRGASVFLEWTNPTTYIDGHPLDSLSAVEVWMAEDRAEEFATKSGLAARIPMAQPPAASAGRFEYALVPAPRAGTSLVFGLKAADSRRRLSAFSGLAAVRIQVLPSPPSGLEAEVGNEAIQLRWDPPPDNIDGTAPARVKGYDLYRSVGGALPVKLNSALITDTRFADTGFEFDADLAYTVRAAAGEAEPYGQSADSAPCRLRPEDTFAPGAPAGLLSLAGPDFISLTWDARDEKDLAGYRVWRRAEGQEDYTELTAAAVRETTFKDSAAERNKRYEYALTAEDAKGNRSGRSDPVAGEIKTERP